MLKTNYEMVLYFTIKIGTIKQCQSYHCILYNSRIYNLLVFLYQIFFSLEKIKLISHKYSMNIEYLFCIISVFYFCSIVYCKRSKVRKKQICIYLNDIEIIIMNLIVL